MLGYFVQRCVCKIVTREPPFPKWGKKLNSKLKVDEDKINLYEFFFVFQDFGSETLRTESEAECSAWKQKLEEATHKHFVTTDQNDNTETISGTIS